MRQIQVSLRQSVRTFSLGSLRFSDEDDSKFKNDPEVKKIMSKIQEDFNPTDKKGDSDPKSSRNVTDLLSELYGEAEVTDTSQGRKEEKGKKFSSVGGISNH